MSMPRPAPVTLQGLCLNCQYPPECGHLRPSAPAVLHCEEHATPPPPPVGCAAVPVALVARRDLASSNGLQGLCINCALSATCQMVRPKGGVWHCNEYR